MNERGGRGGSKGRSTSSLGGKLWLKGGKNCESLKNFRLNSAEEFNEKDGLLSEDLIGDRGKCMPGKS